MGEAVGMQEQKQGEQEENYLIKDLPPRLESRGGEWLISEARFESRSGLCICEMRDLWC